jgi:hypothetical protein
VREVLRRKGRDSLRLPRSVAALGVFPTNGPKRPQEVVLRRHNLRCCGSGLLSTREAIEPYRPDEQLNRLINRPSSAWLQNIGEPCAEETERSERDRHNAVGNEDRPEAD